MTTFPKEQDRGLDKSEIIEPDGVSENLVSPEANKDAEYFRILRLVCAQLYAGSEQIRISLEQTTKLDVINDIGFGKLHSLISKIIYYANGLNGELTLGDSANAEAVQYYHLELIEKVKMIDSLFSPFMEHIALNYPKHFSMFESFFIHFIRVKYITEHPSEVNITTGGDNEWISGVGDNEQRITRYPIII